VAGSWSTGAPWRVEHRLGLQPRFALRCLGLLFGLGEQIAAAFLFVGIAAFQRDRHHLLQQSGQRSDRGTGRAWRTARGTSS
jgi:hypothetical protein